MKNIVTRMAPSPTGFLHIGSLRTALFNYLHAKKNGGRFLLRIEDTDRERFVEGGIENIIRTLNWAGISPDEGPYVSESGELKERGEHGPYIQSNRLEIYATYRDVLLQKGHAYHCFCTKERLDTLRKMQELNKQATGYDGLCRGLSAEEVERRVAACEPSVIRMKVPEEGSTTFTDLIRGEITFEHRVIDDQVLFKADGFPTYHFAVVVDDHLMEVTHISRGEEWLSSTPKHVLLYDMFGWDVPVFAHQPLLVNEQKQKLSKRHGDVGVQDFVDNGYLVEALINFVAFLGWNPGDEREIFSLKELVEEFDLAKMSKSAAVFNREKLAWYNKQYLMSLSIAEITSRAKPFFQNAGLLHKEVTDSWLESAIELERSRVTTLAELPGALGFLFADDLVYETQMLVWKKSDAVDAKEKLEELIGFWEQMPDWDGGKLQDLTMEWIKGRGYGNGEVLWPTRVALSGQKNSPGPFEIAGVLGKEKTLARLKDAVERLS